LRIVVEPLVRRMLRCVESKGKDKGHLLWASAAYMRRLVNMQ